jgi:radical SAM superfamily enzyme YgiQ (UPF0313 family)
MKVYLADLGHNQLTLSSDVYPLGIANLACYAMADPAVGHKLDIRIFREPQDLKAALDACPPDVLGLSSYSWNHSLALHFASYAKARRPEIVTLMGGPNWPLVESVQEEFLRGMPQIDIAVRGPTYEGERAFRNIIRRLDEVGCSVEGVQEESVAGNVWIDRRTGEFVVGKEVERIHDLDEIPSPYLAGLLDGYFETGYFPMMQLARGCPFSCAFCNSSVASNSRVYRHSTENVRADLLYLATRVRPEVNLCFADDNFGMYREDEDVADYLGFLQDRYGWPRYIRTTTGKNKHERIIRVMRKIHGGLPMTSAVQSMNPVVLANIKRSNIKLDTYAEIQKEVVAQGMQSYGELVLSLPGETKATFMKAVSDLMDAGVKRVSAHQLMLLHGAPLSNPDSRAKWEFETRFRVVARNIGDYTGEPIIETEEMVVSTPTFSFEEYLEARVFHLLLTVFYYEGNFEEAFEFAHTKGIKPFDLVTHMQSRLSEAPEGFRRVIDDFVKESVEELFDTREACAAWARENFDALVDGTAGGNLLSKYSMLGRFYATTEALEFLRTSILSALGEGGTYECTRLLDAVIGYLRSTLLQAPFLQSIEATPEWTTWYDVEVWVADGYTRDLEAYEFPHERRFVTTVEDARRAVLETRIRTFGEHPSGLGKFTRTMFARDLRRTVVAMTPIVGPVGEASTTE